MPTLGYLIIRLLALTLRITVLHRERMADFWAQGRAVVVTFWHGRLFLMPIQAPRDKRFTILVSQHRDGEYISRTIRKFGLHTVRGSTTRGSLAGLKQLLRAYRQGSNLVVTPDGPRGPREVVQHGVVELARYTGAPICPVTFGAARKKVLKSWDAFLIPYPFSRAVFLFGEPINVPKDSSREEREKIRLQLQEQMREMNALVDSYFER